MTTKLHYESRTTACYKTSLTPHTCSGNFDLTADVDVKWSQHLLLEWQYNKFELHLAKLGSIPYLTYPFLSLVNGSL